MSTMNHCPKCGHAFSAAFPLCPICKGVPEPVVPCVTVERVGPDKPGTVTFSIPPQELKTVVGEAGDKAHFFLKSELWETCALCKGTTITKVGAMVDGLKRDDGTKYSGPLAPGAKCPACHGGYIQVGMTVGDLERLRARYEMLVALAVEASDFNPADSTPDGIEFALRVLIDKAQEALKKVPRSDVTRARYEASRPKRDTNTPKPG